jgi:transposase-like protein
VANRHYDDDFKLRVVAIASVRGLAAACKQFGLNHETVRAWQAERSDDHALQLAYDLALSELTVDIAEGKNRHKLSTHVGILRDKLERYRRPKVEPRTAEEDEYDAFVAEVEARYPDRHQEHLALVALVRYHHAHRCPDDGPCPEPLPDIWAYVDSLGNLEAWDAQWRIDDHARLEKQLEANRKAAEAAQIAALDADVRATLDAAEAWLKATAP